MLITKRDLRTSSLCREFVIRLW